MEGSINIEIRPSEKQLLFFNSPYKYTLYGGARGGGKSWAVRRKALLLALKYDGIRILIIRRTFPELQENHIVPLREELNGLAKYNDKNKQFNFFDRKSIIKIGYCASEADVLQYQGQQYDVVFLDEATQLTEYQFNTIKAIVRGVNNFPKKMYLTANPGGVGHAWVKRLFIDRIYHGNEKPEEYGFIQSKVYDNKALMEAQPDYVEQLESLDEDLRAAWLDGNWDVFEGQYFKEWNRDIHVMRSFPIPPSWQKYFTMDYGLDMFAGYFIAIDEFGKEYVYKEIYQSGLIASQAADLLRTVNEKDVEIYFAPPDLWNRRNDTGKSVAEIFAEKDIFLSRAKNDRVMGWYNMKEHLQTGYDEHGKPAAGLRIFDCCPNLIRCIPLLQYDDKNPNDVKNEPHEITHAPDAIRYFCSGRTLPPLGSIAPEDLEEDDYDEEVYNLCNYRG